MTDFQEEQVTEIPWFDPNNLKLNRKILMVGKTGTGKSVMLKTIIYHLRDKFDFAIGMAPNLDTVEMLRDFMPDMFIYDGVNADQMNSYIENIKLLQEAKKKKNDDSRFKLLLVADDCMKDKKLFEEKSMRELANNGRHYDMLFIISAQYMIDIATSFRTNIDYVFAMSEDSSRVIGLLYKEYFGMFPTKEQFVQAFKQATENFGCMIVDRTLGGAPLEKTVSFYRGDPKIGKFMVGCRDYWKMSYMLKKDDDIVAELPKNKLLQKRKREQEKGDDDEEEDFDAVALNKAREFSKKTTKRRKNDPPVTLFVVGKPKEQEAYKPIPEVVMPPKPKPKPVEKPMDIESAGGKSAASVCDEDSRPKKKPRFSDHDSANTMMSNFVSSSLNKTAIGKRKISFDEPKPNKKQKTVLNIDPMEASVFSQGTFYHE
jgi:hypothetical protein